MDKTPLQREIIALWHISRTALAGMPTAPSRHTRMLYVKEELKTRYSHLIEGKTNKAVWLAIEEQIN